MKLDPGLASLRAHDIHQGLQSADVDRGGGLVGHELEATLTVGMAAALATAIKGIDVVEDGALLKRVAEQQLDIPTWAFDKVVAVLEETEYIRNVERSTSGKVTKLFESVPEDFRRLYATLDEVLVSQQPGELEESLIYLVDDLSKGPRPLDECDIDADALGPVLEMAAAAEAVRVVQAGDVKIGYSPHFSYEHPETVGSALASLDIEQVRREFEIVRGYQGLPIGNDSGVLQGLVGAGLVAGPAVASADGSQQAFAVAPYGLPPDLLTIRKPVLNKALALLASVRMGQHYGGYTSLNNPGLILKKLLIPGTWVARHSSTHRQYSVLRQMGIVRFDTSQTYRAIQLIDSPDNQEAVRIAIDLMSHGEALTSKEAPVGSSMADPNGTYQSPIRGVRAARKRTGIPAKTIADIWDHAMGWRPSV